MNPSNNFILVYSTIFTYILVVLTMLLLSKLQMNPQKINILNMKYAQ